MSYRYFSLDLKRLVLSGVVLLILKPASSSALTPDAGAILHQEQTLEKARSLPRDTARPVLLNVTPTSAVPDNEKIFVREFRIEGRLLRIKAEELQGLLAGYAGRDLTFSELRMAAARITQYYGDRGYFLARAIVPKQEVQDGVVVIVVNEGQLDSVEPVRINGNELRMREHFARRFITIPLNESLHRPSLERGLLNLNDNPGISATADLKPGTAPGTTKIVVDALEGPLLNGSLSMDNGGSRYVGSWRAIGTININDPFRYGDQLSMTGIAATGEVFRMGKVGYSLPISASGLRANVAYTDLYYELGKEMATDPVSFGKARNLSVSLRYPIFRSAGTALFIGSGYDWKSTINESSGLQTSNKRLDIYNVNLTWQRTDMFLGGGFTQLQVGDVEGTLDLSGCRSELLNDQGVGGAQTDGTYRKFIWQALRIQRGTERLSFRLSADGQFAQKNLDGSEKISLGGPAGVRAYPSGEASGDDGGKLSIDAKYLAFKGTEFGDIVPSFFIDYGWIRQYRDSSLIAQMSTPNTYSLSGLGIGVDVVKPGKYDFKFVWAKALGDNPGTSSSGNNSDGKAERFRFWMVGNISF